MFSGKSTVLYRQVSRALRAKKTVQVFVPRLDRRSDGQVVTHDRVTLSSLKITPLVVDSSREMFDVLMKPDVAIIDEAQFFDHDLPLFIPLILDQGTTIVVAGLDQTSEGEPFGPMPHLMSLADRVEKLTAICHCGAEATRTLCRVEKTGTVDVGGAEKYVPACYRCWRNKVGG